MFSDNNGIKLDINNRRKYGNPHYLEIKQHVSKQPMGQNEITTEIRRYFELNEMKAQFMKIYVISKSSTCIYI